jgi:hypothetical protein
MGTKSKITLVVVAATAWLLLLGLIRESSAELTATVKTDKAKYQMSQGQLLDPISTWITLKVSQDVYVEPDFLQRPFEWRLNMRDPDRKRIIHNHFKENPPPPEFEPLPRPPGEKKILLAAGDYHVFLEDLAEHFAITKIGPHMLKIVISVSTHADEDGNNKNEKIVSSKIDKFEVFSKSSVAVDIDPDTLSLKGKGKWITAYLSAFPDGYSAVDVDIGSVKLLYNGGSVSEGGREIQGSTLMVKFDRAAVQNMLSAAAEVELKLTGNFNAWSSFSGSDTIRCIEGGGKK